MEFELKRKIELVVTEKASWHMIYLPIGISRELRRLFAGLEGGFGSLPVQVTIGETSWKTSIFSESKNGAFLLLLNAKVRKKEQIQAGKVLSFSIKILL